MLRISTPFPEQLSRPRTFFRLVDRGMMASCSALEVRISAKRSSAHMYDTIRFSKPYCDSTSTKSLEVVTAGGETWNCRLKRRPSAILPGRLRFDVCAYG
jgi:hypothetical protein